MEEQIKIQNGCNETEKSEFLGLFIVPLAMKNKRKHTH
jgi:hypothetical protein